MTNKPKTCSLCSALKGNNRRKLVLEIELKKKSWSLSAKYNASEYIWGAANGEKWRVVTRLSFISERQKMWRYPPLRLAFSPNLRHVSLPSLSTTIFSQMGCEDGPL